MATFTKFAPFVENLAEKKFDFGADQLTVALTNAANAPSTDASQLSELTQIAYTNLSSRNITTSASSQTAGTYAYVPSDLTLTASGGSVATFRYVVIYDDTAANDELVCFFDYGADVTLAAGETFTIDFDTSLFEIT